MKDVLLCYKVLGIEPGAPPERVRRAYLHLAHFYDPGRYVAADRDVRNSAEEKRREIEDAYVEIRHFLPDLQRHHDHAEKTLLQNRDFEEMSTDAPQEISKMLMTALVGGVLLFLFSWAYYIYRQTRVLPSAHSSVVDPEAIGQGLSPVASTASISIHE